MTKEKTVLVIGTGTIGYPLIQRLVWSAAYAGHPYFAWNEIIFHKKRPLLKNVPRLKGLLGVADNGVRVSLCVDEQTGGMFQQIGLNPSYTLEEAIDKADLVFDVTPTGLSNKGNYQKYAGKIFVAQGSEYRKDKKFGRLFVGGINEGPVQFGLLQGEQFFVVGSCNATSLARGVKVIGEVFGSPFWGVEVEATIVRRSDDLNKTKIATSFSFSVPDEQYEEEGTYHAYNVLEAFRSIGREGISLDTEVGKLMDPYMHGVFWRVRVPKSQWPKSWPEGSFSNFFLSKLRADPWCILTHEEQANVIYYDAKTVISLKSPRWIVADRCFGHLIFFVSSLRVSMKRDHVLVRFQTYTPQDSNVLWTNLEIAAMTLVRESFSSQEFLNLTRPMFEPKEI